MYAVYGQATTMAAPLVEEWKQVGAAGFRHIDAWLAKLEAFLKNEQVSTLKQMLGDLNLGLVCGSFQGGLMRPPGEARKAHEDHFKKRLDLCEALAIPTMVLACDSDGDPGPQSLNFAIEGLVRACQWADAYKVRIALEFQARNRLVNNLETAAMVIKQAAQPNLGLCLDLFQYWIGPSKEMDLELCRHVPTYLIQVSDLSGVPREWATDSHRILPGDGEIPLGPLLAKMGQMGYSGPVSVELLNPKIWQIKPTQVAEVAFSALKRLFPTAPTPAPVQG